jgi:hypothetical protein
VARGLKRKLSWEAEGDEHHRSSGMGCLTPVYGWFTEGFDTRDLKEAKSLLIELG